MDTLVCQPAGSVIWTRKQTHLGSHTRQTLFESTLHDFHWIQRPPPPLCSIFIPNHTLSPHSGPILISVHRPKGCSSFPKIPSAPGPSTSRISLLFSDSTLRFRALRHEVLVCTVPPRADFGLAEMGQQSGPATCICASPAGTRPSSHAVRYAHTVDPGEIGVFPDTYRVQSSRYVHLWERKRSGSRRRRRWQGGTIE